MGSITIFESGKIEQVTMDTAYAQPVKLGFNAAASGSVNVEFEDGSTAVLEVAVIQSLQPRVVKVITSSTTVTTTDIFVGYA